MQVVCPGCRAVRAIDANTQVGALVSCASCAGVLFRLVQEHDTYLLRELPQASCPVCGTMLRLPDGAHAGVNTTHCDRTFIVTYAYGAYALEGVDSEREGA